MNAPEGPAAPKDGTSEIPTFEQLAADPEIAALLDFEPVPRRFEREDGWTPALQRRFIAYLAWTGSPGKACDALGKRRSGIDKLAKLEGAASFRAAWARAVEIAQERKAARVAAAHAPTADLKLPFVDHRRKHAQPQQQGPLPGQVMNELGEYEDEDSYLRRAEDAKDGICGKLVRARRLYLMSISNEPVKRAAFEILTELPVDWDLAGKLQPQPFEPWTRTNQREPDMILTAESGWSWGEAGYGPDRMAELRQAIDEHRAEEGLEPVDWDSE
jgi:hypothetical protein